MTFRHVVFFFRASPGHPHGAPRNSRTHCDVSFSQRMFALAKEV